MKDWDQQADEEGSGEGVDGHSDSDAGDDDGW
jgi:hypothetical protein